MQDLMIAISDPTRRAALALLWGGGEHCVCELMARLGASQSRMSRHMKILKQAGLVIGRRDAQWVRYRRDPTLARGGEARGLLSRRGTIRRLAVTKYVRPRTPQAARRIRTHHADAAFRTFRSFDSSARAPADRRPAKDPGRPAPTR